MENLLLKYMGSRVHEPLELQTGKPLPFVTISREFGCPSKLIAKTLSEELNHRTADNKPRWQYINKEIVEQAAQELELEPVKVQHLFSMDQTSILDDVLSSFSANYKSTLKIRKTIRQVIHSFTKKGYVIIVGRGSVAITQGIPDALHIRLQAPLDWRVSCISRQKEMPYAEALHLTNETDRKRTALIESFLGHKLDSGIFDVTFNCKTLSIPEIVDTAIELMKARKLV